MKDIEFKQPRKNNYVNKLGSMSNNYQYTKNGKVKGQNYQEIRNVNTVFSIYTRKNVNIVKSKIPINNKYETNNKENIQLIIYDNNTPLKPFYN